MNRQLSCLIDNQVDSPVKLAEELVQHGFIHPLDSGAIQVHRSLQFWWSSNDPFLRKCCMQPSPSITAVRLLSIYLNSLMEWFSRVGDEWWVWAAVICRILSQVILPVIFMFSFYVSNALLTDYHVCYFGLRMGCHRFQNCCMWSLFTKVDKPRPLPFTRLLLGGLDT